MKRRQFITLIGGAAAWPVAARAQKPAMPVVGWLSSGSSIAGMTNVAAFLQSLNEAGFVDGHNVKIEYRWADNQYDRLPALAADLVRHQPAVIAANYPSVLAVKEATATIPIVFVAGGDPIRRGLVASLNRPGGNLTGVSNLNAELSPKRLELIHEMIPTATLVAILINPTNPAGETQSREVQEAARTLGLKSNILHASTEGDFESVFATLAQLHAGALLIGTDAFFIDRGEQLGAMTAAHSVPAIFEYRDFASAGGLLSYGGSVADNFRLLAVYVGRVLKGEKPAELPVQQSTKVELIINLKTAKALSLTVPITLLDRADEVIE